VQPWLPLAFAALLVWSIQRVVTKAALVHWSTARFYRLNAILSLAVYIPFAFFVPPEPDRLPAALGLSLLMALTFWITTEATRRGPVGLVAPLTAISPVITVALAVTVLAERLSPVGTVGVLLALTAAALLAYRPVATGALAGWLALALVSLVLQGVGAFIAKLVVTGAGPTDLLLTSAAVQAGVGIVIARAEPLDIIDTFGRRPNVVVACTMAAAAAATIGYLWALSLGPASIIVPLVATSPALGGVLGVILLREQTTRRQVVGAFLGIVAAALLSVA